MLQKKEGAAVSGRAAGKEGREVLQAGREEGLQEGKVLREGRSCRQGGKRGCRKGKRCGKGGPAGREEGLQEGKVLRELLDEVCVLQAINKLPTKAAAQHCLRFDLRGRKVRKFSSFT